MDIFKEYMVTRRQDGKDRLKVFGLVFLCSLALTASLVFINYIAEFMGFVIFGILAGFYGCYIYALYRRIEYEYIFTNGDLDIDKIMGQRKRKRLATIDMATLTQFGMCYLIFTPSEEFVEELKPYFPRELKGRG